MRKNEEDQGTKLVRYTLGILLGGAAALVVCLLILLLASVGVSRGTLSLEHTYQITIASCVISAFLGAIVAIRRCGARTLVTGLLIGIVFFLLLLTVGVVFFHADSPGSGGIGLICGSLLGGAAAGLLTSGLGHSRHKKYRQGSVRKRD